ncbi:cystinosin-like [Halichondria panicea]|uniref:cystinosin-like n=1 Tax=Halichondria panicea TaxID=6063 RepID=UPI00312B78A1
MLSQVDTGVLLLLLCCVHGAWSQGNCVEYAKDDELNIVLCMSRPETVQVNENTTLEIWTKYSYFDNFTNATEVTLELTFAHDIVDGPSNVTLRGGNKSTVVLYGLGAGRTLVSLTCPNNTDNDTCPFSEEYLALVEREVAFVHSLPLNIIIAIVGWIYFAAWSVSFYPQIILNFRRRSVVGLNFDFIALNITGFLCYSAFNVGLFWITPVQQDYFLRHPAGVNPVQINDVVFALHAVAATIFTIFQCLIFERGGQRVSYSAMLLLTAMWLVIFISLFVSVGNKLSWLDYLYVLSYVKLAVTLVKYVPQAWLNCKRKSTEGWSIGNVLLDFTGGSFSILQMFLLSYNYDDWQSIFGDPTKFGLGAFSIIFDILFISQHYIIYPKRKRNKKKRLESNGSTEETAPLIQDKINSTPTETKKGLKKFFA